MKHPSTHWATLFSILLLATACAKTDVTTPTVDNSNDNLTMGNPSGAVASITSHTNYLLVKLQCVVSYNRDQRKPIWVS
jgi:endonuclease G